MAKELSQSLGREVRAEAIPTEQWEAQARRFGLNDDAVETLKAMFQYYTRYGLIGNPNVLRWLLGRPATTLADFLQPQAPHSRSA